MKRFFLQLIKFLFPLFSLTNIQANMEENEKDTKGIDGGGKKLSNDHQKEVSAAHFLLSPNRYQNERFYL